MAKLIYKSPKRGGGLSSPIDESDERSRAILEEKGWRVVERIGEQEEKVEPPAPPISESPEPENEEVGGVFADLTIAELRDVAEAEGVDLGGATRKADIIEALEAALAEPVEEDDLPDEDEDEE